MVIRRGRARVRLSESSRDTVERSAGRRRFPWAWCVAAALFASVVLGAGLAIADVPDGNTVNACRNKTTFAIRVIDKDAVPPQSCTTSETAISWANWKMRGAFSATTQYNAADVVVYAGSSYVATLKPPKGTAPTNATYWALVAQRGAQGPPGPTGPPGPQGLPGPSSLDALSGTVCNSGTPAVGTLQVRYDSTGSFGVTVTCVPNNIFTLTVSTTGLGSGTVTASPSEIKCGAVASPVCSANFAGGTGVVLSATPQTNYTFEGWSGGGCTGMALTCNVTMSDAQSVTAQFGNTSATAVALAVLHCGFSMTKTGTIANGAHEWYQLVVQLGSGCPDTASVVFPLSGPPVFPRMNVYDSSMTPVPALGGGTGANLPADGTYYLEIFSSINATGTWQLNITG